MRRQGTRRSGTAVLDPEEIEAEVNSSRAQLLSSEANQKGAEADMKRAEVDAQGVDVPRRGVYQRAQQMARTVQSSASAFDDAQRPTS